MAEYIDRFGIMKAIMEDMQPFTVGMVARHIRELPASDVVEVVRCKDCKHLLPDDWDGEILYGCGCTSGMDSPYLEGFCSYGERKEPDHD